jgi:hypothetical protein
MAKTVLVVGHAGQLTAQRDMIKTGKWVRPLIMYKRRNF